MEHTAREVCRLEERKNFIQHSSIKNKLTHKLPVIKPDRAGAMMTRQLRKTGRRRNDTFQCNICRYAHMIIKTAHDTRVTFFFLKFINFY